MQKDYENMLDGLLFNLMDFDLISERLLPEQLGDITNELAVGAMRYSAVLVPALETIRSSTLEILEKFADRGGRVVFAGGCPAYVDGRADERAKALYCKSMQCRLTGYDLCEALKDERLIDICLENGMRSNNLIYNMREEADNDWLFIAHCTVKQPVTDCSRPEKIYIKIRGEYSPSRYDTVNGEIKNILYRVSNGYTYIETVLYYHDSLMLKLDRYAQNHSDAAFTSQKTVTKTIDFKHKVCYSRDEDNVLLLDLAQWSLDGGEMHEKDEILKIDNACRSLLGLPGKPRGLPQPWAMKPEKPMHSIKLVFDINSECELNGVRLALEDAEKARIFFNGAAVDSTPVGYYVDECYKTLALPCVKQGLNILEITLPFGMTTNTEWCYLVGDFDVKVDGMLATLTSAKRELAFGSITSQGLPFYGGTVTYKTEIDVPECDLRVRVNRYRGAMVRVGIDGEDKGCIVYDPYTLDIPGVKSGKHTVEFTVYLSRYNTFASIHNISGDCWIGPNHWYTDGDKWCYEYVLKDTGILASPVIEVLE